MITSIDSMRTKSLDNTFNAVMKKLSTQFYPNIQVETKNNKMSKYMI